MNRTASIRVTGLNLGYLKENLTFILLLLLVVISILIGVLSVGTDSVNAATVEIFGEYVSERTDKSFLKAFLSSLITALKIPLISFLCGTSVLGLVISPLALSMTAFWYGCLAGYVYFTYGLSGIVFNLFVLILPTLILLFSLLLSARECVAFSKLIAIMCIRDTRPINLYMHFRNFCLKHIVMLIPIIVSSLLDTALFNLFEKYFNF